MNDYEKLINEIQLLREHLHKLINKKGDLSDKEIISVSKKMDVLINKVTEKKNEKPHE
jgi:ElaB/YqjD/DUF883 family membrane-anchored ribosome-binding protein